jgi:hypothetical protein
MAYFNHAFSKVFLGTQTSGAAPLNPNPNLVDGFLITAGLPTSVLGNIDAITAANNYGPGSYGLFNAKTYLSVDASGVTGCCPLILASASLLANDKIGPFHGGYKESNKSKLINPKFIRNFYRVDQCIPQQSIVSIGNTPFTAVEGIATLAAFVAGTETYVNGVYTDIVLIGGTGSSARATVTVVGNVVTAITITDAGTGYTIGDVLTLSSAAVATAGSLTELVAGTATTAAVLTLVPVTAGCCFEFLCGETYYLRIDIKGSPTLRYLNHQAYQTVDAYTGCCPEGCSTPVAVDSTLVMIKWAENIVSNAYLTPFIAPVVFDEVGTAWYAPGTTVSPQGVPVLPTQTWDAYVSPGHVAGACAGLRLFGAYVETKFGNCSFQLTDFYEKEPVKILASLVDYTGDVCAFEGICVITECAGVQGMGFGESVVRDLILSESYLQNFFHSDIRIREITQGDQILGAVNRNALYTRYYILHSVPRYNNPTGVFDNDQYLLEIISSGINASFESLMGTWLGTCTDCVELEVQACTPCVVLAD